MPFMPEGAITRALFANMKPLPEPDPKADALIMIGFLLRQEEPTAWRVLEGGEFCCGRFADHDGSILYHVSHVEIENATFFTAIYENSGISYETYVPGKWRADLERSYEKERKEFSKENVKG